LIEELMRINTIALLACITAAEVAPASMVVAQSLGTRDSVQHRSLSGKQAAVAGILLLTSGLADEGLREELQEHRSGTTNSFARLGNAVGEPLYLISGIGVGLLAGELSGNKELRHLAWRVGRAAAIASAVTTVVKYTIGRTRPTHGDSHDFQPFGGGTSFPSGHTTLAFAVATAIADESQNGWVDAAAYGAATLTAYARVNDDRHWASDVLAGALIGHLSARWLSRRDASLRLAPQSVGLSFGF
jgi:membrane-associated phospholipid phosphatase